MSNSQMSGTSQTAPEIVNKSVNAAVSTTFSGFLPEASILGNVTHTVLSVFQTAALASDIMDKLDQPGQFTLFAPTNEAFLKLSPGYLERIMKDKSVIAGMLQM